MTSTPAEHPISANQLQCAEALGIDVAGTESLSALIARIESAAGERALLERVRWFVLSVLRHLRHAEWDKPEASELSVDQQYDLSRECLEAPGFAKSVATVSKADTCKYTLVQFHRKKDAGRRIMSTNTSAYRLAAAVLYGADLVRGTPAGTPAPPDSESKADAVAPESQPIEPKSNETKLKETILIETILKETKPGETQSIKEAIPPDSPQVTVTTADVRRARRRGYVDEQEAIIDTLEQVATTRAVSKVGMSAQEYAELEQALAREDTAPAAESLDLGDRDGRISWLLGVVAGLVLFGLWWLVT